MRRIARYVLVLLVLAGYSADTGVPASATGAAALQVPAVNSADLVRIGIQRGNRYEVTTLPMDEYVARVLAGEAAPDTPPAALEALAIAVRTYTTTNRRRHASQGFDLCDQTHCQVMRTANADTERAARATSGQILRYRGVPATVYYSASCGGRSEKPSNVWPGADDPPYLSIHDDDGCEGFPQWSSELAEADLQRAFSAEGYKGRLRDIQILSRDESGRVAVLALDGLTPRRVSGQDLRMVLGRTLGFQHVQSTLFDLRHEGKAFRFTGRGAGHGVGMCVIGSMKLAARGVSAAEILARYYPGTDIGPVPATSAPVPTRGGAAPTAAPPVAAPPIAAPPVAAPPIAGASPAAAARQPQTATRQPAATAAMPGDVAIAVPEGQEDERAPLAALASRERAALAQTIGVPAPPLRIRVHDSSRTFETATGRQWFVMGTVIGSEIHLLPLDELRQRGMLEATLRRQIVHVMVDPVLPATPAWVRVGAAMYFADPPSGDSGRTQCPDDIEVMRPLSLGALGDAWTRARACFDRAAGEGGRDWRKVH